MFMTKPICFISDRRDVSGIQTKFSVQLGITDFLSVSDDNNKRVVFLYV